MELKLGKKDDFPTGNKYVLFIEKVYLLIQILEFKGLKGDIGDSKMSYQHIFKAFSTMAEVEQALIFYQKNPSKNQLELKIETISAIKYGDVIFLLTSPST